MARGPSGPPSVPFGLDAAAHSRASVLPPDRRVAEVATGQIEPSSRPSADAPTTRASRLSSIATSVRWAPS